MSESSTDSIRTKEDLLQYEKTLDCIHCGLCLPACPTYELLGRESAGPRGRIYLLRGLAEGQIEPTDPVTRDLDLCLVCRACEPVCPSGVRFGEMMEFGRSEILEPRRRFSLGRVIRRFFVRHLIPYPRRLKPVVFLLSLYQRSGLQALIRRSGILRAFSSDLALRDSLLPRIPPAKARRALAAEYPARGEKRGRVALLEGCVAPILLGDVNRSTAYALAAQGFEVIVPRRGTCCGALAAHFGAVDVATEAAKRTMAAFRDLGRLDAIIVNSAGCGSVMKEYGRMLAESEKASEEDRRYSDGFSRMVWDFSEFLVDQGIRPPPQRVEARIAYADACHLIHAQGIQSQPRELLAEIDGVTEVALANSDRCCGAAGLYNALNPRESMALLEPRLEDLKRSGANTLATANPGCLLQWAMGIEQQGLDVEVLHPAQILARAHGDC